jgi:hypothetical protein
VARILESISLSAAEPLAGFLFVRLVIVNTPHDFLLIPTSYLSQGLDKIFKTEAIFDAVPQGTKRIFLEYLVCLFAPSVKKAVDSVEYFVSSGAGQHLRIYSGWHI